MRASARTQILSALGTGGMGEVYRALDTKLKRDVALKVLPPAFAQDPDRLARFQREAELLATLNHPNVAAIFSIEEAGGVHFMTMELVDGCTLEQMTPRGTVSMAQLFDIAIALADALSAAHRKHIIHRDLKPANVMMTDDGRVKVLDLGLARAVDPDPVCPEDDVTHLGLTQAGIIVGTVPYMSPEQIEAKQLDHRTDLFSLGVLLYELATGERPFRGDSSPALMSSILKDHPKPIEERRPDIPHAVSRLIERCLEKHPRDRIQTATEILAELKAQRRAWESGAAWALRPAAPHIAPRPVERVASIAVLPFTDMSAAKDQDWFCDGIAEEILNALTPLKGLRVAARTSAFSFKGKGEDLRTIGEKLNVTTVLAGSLRRAGDRVRITVQLSDVADGFQLWSERYDRELKDIFDVQDEIAKAIAERLQVTLAGGKEDRLVEQGTTNVDAYQLYLKGHALLGRRGTSIPAALDLFRKAVEIDPNYSLAWAGVADACSGLAITGSMSGTESKPQAIGGRDTVDRARSHLRGRPRRAGVRDLTARKQPCDGEAGVRASLGAQAELRAGPQLVRVLLFAVGPRGPRAGHRRSPPRARKRSVVLVRRDDSRMLSVHSRPAGRSDRDGPPGRSTRSRVVHGALGARCLAQNGRTIRRGGVHARDCRRDVGAPLARPLQPRGSFRTVGEAVGGECAASRTDGPRLASLCPADVPFPHG